MIEVFKTNVKNSEQAKEILDVIHKSFNGYRGNFDLQDCDNILRIECKNDYVESNGIIYLLRENNCDAEMLEDIIAVKWSDEGYSKRFSQVY